jgi:hypothetical protein
VLRPSYGAHTKETEEENGWLFHWQYGAFDFFKIRIYNENEIIKIGESLSY